MTPRLALSEGCGLVDTIDLMASGAREGGVAMRFKGEVLPVGELLERARSAPEPDWRALSGEALLRHTAQSNARECSRLLTRGESLASCWRFGVLQSLDDYSSAVQRGSLHLGAKVFDEKPAPTGARELDAAFAALADHLAERDGWDAPEWAGDPRRVTDDWFPDVPAIFRDEAQQQSPRAFRERGIFITAASLNRA